MLVVELVTSEEPVEDVVKTVIYSTVNPALSDPSNRVLAHIYLDIRVLEGSLGSSGQ